MKRVFKGINIQKSILIIAMFFFTVFQSNGQHSKPSASGYAPVNGIKVYYEGYMERVNPSFYYMVLFITLT